MPKVTRLCDVDGCGRKHRARGLCAAHYNQQNRGARKTVEVKCPTCGEMSTKQDNGKSTRKFCSLFCRDLWTADNYPPPPGPRRPRGRRVCPLPADHPVRMISPLDVKWCKCCGQEFMCKPGARVYCTQSCAWRAKAKARGRRHLRRREDIFERDGYMCWLCDEPTSDRYTPGDIWSPTIDHLTPVSLGGGDDPENLATAHMWCNSVRGNSLDISPAA